MNKSFPKIKIIITAALVFLPINISWAQHCDPSWTAEYSCMEGCGHCPSSSSSSASAAPQADNQVGMMGAQMLGQGIAQMILGNQQEAVDARNEALNLNNQGLQYFNNGQWQLAANDFIAALQRSNDPIIQKNLEMAQQKLAEQRQKEMQVAIDQKNQEIHDRLSSEMKFTDNGTSLSGGERSGQQKLELMKDDDNTLPQSLKNNITPDDAVTKSGETSLALTTAEAIAARARGDAAFEQYVKEHGNGNIIDREAAVSRAMRGEGYTKEELKEQLQQGLKEYHKKHDNSHDIDKLNGPPTANDVSLGGKG